MALTPITEATVLWRFLSGGGPEAYCSIAPHPIGHELRYVFNGVQLIGVVGSDIEQLEERSNQWKDRLRSDGWAEATPRMSVRPVLAGRVGA
jgi:hypothetical protein